MISKKKEKIVRVLDSVFGMEELRKYGDIAGTVSLLKERLSDDEFRIAVVGEFSSGKSTFINAILGRDILKHAATETTATVTRIVNVPKNDPRSMTGKVTMRNGVEVPLEGFDDLTEFTTTNSRKYQDRVPEKIESVELYMPITDIACPIVFVDTPGLNGMADGHREQTVELIQKAHSCIYLIGRGGLRESDVSFLDYLVKIQKNFIFVQNFIDELKESEGDTVEKKLAEQRSILERTVFEHEPQCKFELCGVSSLMELCSADDQIERLYADAPEPLTADDRLKLHIQSRFEEFRRVLETTFREENMDDLRYGGAELATVNWILSLRDRIAAQENRAREYFNASREKGSLEKLEKIRERIIAGEEKQKDNLRNFVDARGEEIRREECVRLEREFEALKDRMAEEISKIPSIDKMEQFEKNLPSTLMNRIHVILEKSNRMLKKRYQAFYQVLLSRIDEYSGYKNEGQIDLEMLDLQILQENKTVLTKVKEYVDDLKQDLNDMRIESQKLMEEDRRLKNAVRNAEKEEASLLNARQDLEWQKENDLTDIGERPEPEIREERYTYYEYRGGWGIMDALFGPKEVTRWRTVQDDTAGKEWDRKKQKIENDFTLEIDSLTGELNAAKRKIKELEFDFDMNQHKIERLEEKKDELQKKIIKETELQEQIKKKAADEFLASRKKSVNEQIGEYLLGDDGVYAQTENNMRSVAEDNGKAFKDLAMTRFGQAVCQKLKWIEQTMREKSPDILRQADELKDLGERLSGLINELCSD